MTIRRKIRYFLRGWGSLANLAPQPPRIKYIKPRTPQEAIAEAWAMTGKHLADSMRAIAPEVRREQRAHGRIFDTAVEHGNLIPAACTTDTGR